MIDDELVILKIVSQRDAPSVISAPVTWTSSHKLTVDSYNSIRINKPVVIEGTSGLNMLLKSGLLLGIDRNQ